VTWAIWLTGPPASGKTALAREFLDVAAAEGVRAVHLESDTLRRILTPEPTYERAERDRFYRQLADLAALLVAQGFPVVVDATASRREYRDRARRQIQPFLEVLVATSQEARRARDPKGLYAMARAGGAPHLPGAGERYEEPLRPELILSGEGDVRAEAARLLAAVRGRGWPGSAA
jgi:adenylylsulfate kinase